MLATKERIISRRQVSTERYIRSTLPTFYTSMRRDWQGSNQFLSDDGSGRLGTVTGPLWTPQGGDFDGIDDQITFADSSPLDPTTSITLAAWVYCHAAQGAHNEFISKGNNDTTWEAPYGQYRFFLINNIFYLRLAVGGTAYELTSNETFANNVWHHPVGTYDNETMKIYVNGRFMGQDTTPSGNLNTYATLLRIGRLLSGATSEEFDGLIGDVLIYNRALSDIEIRQLHQMTKWRYQ